MMNRNTKRHGRRAVSMLASALGLASAFGADLVVPREGLAPTASATYDTIIAHGDLTIGAGVSLTATTFKLAPDQGDCATVTVRDGGKLTVTGSGSTYGENGGGTGFFDVRSPGSSISSSSSIFSQAAFSLSKLTISANATSTNEYYDILRVNEGTVAVLGTVDVSANVRKTTRIRFNGGCVVQHYGTSGNWFSIPQGSHVLLESVDGHPIHLAMNYTEPQTFFNGGVAWTSGAGDFIFDSNYQNSGVNIYGDETWNGFKWGHSGDLVLTNKFWFKQWSRHNILPYGTGKGIVRMHNSAILDIYSKTNALNGLTVVDSAMVTNSGSVAGLLRFGTWNEDSSLSAKKIAAKCPVEKSGTGTLSVRNTLSDSALGVAGGTADFFNSAFTGITVEDGATFQIGSNVGYSVFTTIQTNQTAGDGSLLKTGNNTLQWSMAAGVPKKVSVEGGTLQFIGAACPNPWYRFVFKKTNGGKPLVVGKLGLVDAMGNHLVIDKGFTFSKGVAAVDMAPGSYTIPADATYVTGDASDGHGAGTIKMGVGNLVSTALTYGAMEWGGTPLPDDETTWQSVTFRLKSGAAPAVGYVIHTDWSNDYKPASWMVETSSDGLTWETIDERTDYVPYTYSCRTYDSSGKYLWWNNRAPIGWTQGAPVVGRSFGAERVRLANGGVLDLTAYPESGRAISDLEIDWSTGGGTVKGFAPAVGGTLRLAGMPNGVSPRNAEVPLAITGLSQAANLSSWRVHVNGTIDRTLAVRAKADGSGLVVYRSGFSISFR